MRGDDDRLPHALQLFEQLLDLDARAGIQTRGGLVQEEHLGVMNERFRQAEALLHAARQFLDVGISLLGEIRQLQHILDDVVTALLRDLVGSSEKVEVLPHFDVVVDAEEVRHVADDGADRLGLADDVEAGDGRRSGRGAQEGGEHLDRRRLPGAVGADEAEDIPLFQVEAEVIHRDQCLILLAQLLDCDQQATSHESRRGAAASERSPAGHA